jgi:DDE superfamily endonuclease
VIVVICDNDSIHHARKVTAYLKEQPRLELLYGARYSPHDNPAERIWAALKNYVANTAVSWPGRLRQIHSFFRTRSPDQMLATAAPWTSPWLPPGYEQNFWNAALARAPFDKLGIQRRHGSLGSRRQQMPVYLVGHVDVSMPKEVGKLGDLDASREHRRRVGMAQRVRREPVRDAGCLGSVHEPEVDRAVLLEQPVVTWDERAIGHVPDHLP